MFESNGEGKGFIGIVSEDFSIKQHMHFAKVWGLDTDGFVKDSSYAFEKLLRPMQSGDIVTIEVN